MKINQFTGSVLFLIALLASVASACAPLANIFEDDRDASFLKIPAITPKFKVETVATNMEVVWSIVFAPDGRVFFTERPGRLRVIENGKLRGEPLAVISEVEPSGESGLMGMALHPQFASNHFLYLAFAYQKNGEQLVKVARYRETGAELTEDWT